MKTILIVDDDHDFVEILDIFLTKSGYKTKLAFNGMQAITEINESHIDLMLLDIFMPEMDGFEVIQTLHSNDKCPKIISMSGMYLDSGFLNMSLEFGASDYLTKPFDLDSLTFKIENNLVS